MDMDLLQFVKQLPEDWVLCPIYRKGATMRSGKLATGKNPHEDGHDLNLNCHDVALRLERNPKLAAVGLWTGIRGNGLVVLDVDRNLGSLRRKWGESLDNAPVITSTKKNAAKFIFRVPEELWREVAGFGLREDSGHSYEVLWGRQGLIFGRYPGSTDGKAPEGFYGFEGDPHKIPEAPSWLIAEMKAAKAGGTTGFIKNRTALDVSDRTEDEIAGIIQECLGVIENKGVGSREHWIRIGMAIHSVLPGDLGLELWSSWSRKDSEYHDEWEQGNPCEESWKSFKPGKIGLGSLIFLADQVDPKRARFTKSSLQILEAAEVGRFTLNRDVVLPFEEIIRRGMEIYEGEDVARMNYELHALSVEARYRDQSQLERLLLDHITQKNQEAARTMENRNRSRREFLIPGLLPYGYLLLLFGDAGCGKSATALALMKHVVDGNAFQLKDQVVPVEAGPVIYFNADMSTMDFEEEYDLHEIKNGHRFHFVPDFNLYRQAQFVKKMNEVKPSMICIDSLSSCSGAKAGDENKAEFAQPLYWLSAKNGVLWPACTIVVLHHAAKATGGARGSSAIAAAVSEVWNISHPKKDTGFTIDQRVITVGKSRLNRSGETLIQTQNDDLTVSLVEVKKPEELQTRAGTVADRIMNRLQTRRDWMSRRDLNSDPLVGGSVSAIVKTLQRLENRGVVEIKEEETPGGGRPMKFYRSISHASARGERQKVSTSEKNPVVDREEQLDTQVLEETCPLVPPSNEQQVDNSPENNECPVDKPSAGAASDDYGTLSTSPRARTQEEQDAVLDQSFWDL